MKIAIQIRLQLASYTSSSKEIQSGQTVVPKYLSALKGKIEKDDIVSAHKSRFIRKTEDLEQITNEDDAMASTGQKRKQESTHGHAPSKKKIKR
eukprot:Seg3465.4 transcript_id=Seg3465.4/GoldUCD/mRNA.D3Y31 product="hypothetical protein" pseudo=true protein_id=Seg3465.4/GoldUCD/D3Y31